MILINLPEKRDQVYHLEKCLSSFLNSLSQVSIPLRKAIEVPDVIYKVQS